MKSIFELSILAISLLTIATCNRKENSDHAGGWLQGTEQEKFDAVANQLRGFDVAMVETGYRYQELYWAGIDKNWDYANYQIEKISVAIENGLERRPKRAASAESFLTDALPAMEKIVKQRDSTTFLQGMQTLTTSCNACHAKEKVPFFTVNLPVTRQSPIRK